MMMKKLFPLGVGGMGAGLDWGKKGGDVVDISFEKKARNNKSSNK